MKNILYKITFAVMLSSTLFSCTSIMDGYDVENVEENYYFNPPTWIHGKWVVEDEVNNPDVIFQFKAHDYLEIDTETGVSLGYTELFRSVEDVPGQRFSVVENAISADKYDFKIVGENGSFMHYDFQKENPTKLKVDYYDAQGNILTGLSHTMVKIP